MKKYIYHNKTLRCKVKYCKSHNHFELQIQKKSFLFWSDVYKWWKTVQEYDTGSITITTYQYGNKCELHPEGSLNLIELSLNYLKEYAAYLEMQKQNENRVKYLFNYGSKAN